MKNERLGNGKNISVFLIVEGVAHIILSLISEQNSILFGLSMQQILSFCVLSLGILFVPKNKNSHVRRNPHVAIFITSIKKSVE